MLKHTMILIRRGDELLLLNRQKKPWVGRWMGVGGRIEPGETPLEGALREVAEETGLKLSTARYAGTATWYVEETGHEGGMYLFVADVPAALEYATPRATAEGLLDWKAIDWVFSPDQTGVADHFARFAPVALHDPALYNHHFHWRGGGMEYVRRPLDGSGQ